MSSKADSFNILEIDTILLGEVVDSGVLQKLDHDKYKLQENYLDLALNAVCFKDNYYAVPTLHCANFLIELIDGDVDSKEKTLRPLVTAGNHTLEELKSIVQRLRVSPQHIH